MNKNALQWPEALPSVSYSCAVCSSAIEGEPSYDADETGTVYVRCYTPSSRYWNTVKAEVYCSGEHMMEAHLKG